MSKNPVWQIQYGEGPLVAAAIHDGGEVRDELVELFKIAPHERLREQDPYTGMWTSIAPTRIVGLRSRFEVDLNRPREKAVYRTPEDAWGLKVWKRELPEEMIARSLANYDAFYEHVHHLLQQLVLKNGRVIVFDLHSYNHRRQGPDAPVDDPNANPDINIGTGSMDRVRWSPIIERFINEASAFDYQGRQLDVRENVKFRGGHFGAWVHEKFPDSVCVISIEFKKFFMDEWKGSPNLDDLYAIGQLLGRVSAAVEEELISFEPTISS